MVNKEKLQKIIENNSSEVAAEEILELFKVDQETVDLIKWLYESPYVIDSASIPKKGIEAAPNQVVGNLSLCWVKYEELKKIYKIYNK